MDCPTAVNLEARHPDVMEAILEGIGETIWDHDHTCSLEEGEDGYFWVSDIQAMNACNHAITGAFWVGGKEYSFEAESGDWNGWVWRSVSEDDAIPEIKIHQTVWALQPNEKLVSEAILKGQGKFLVAKWDAFLTRKEYAELPGKYGYDRHFAPGLKTEHYWKEKAGEVGFILVDKETADETRSRLHQ